MHRMIRVAEQGFRTLQSAAVTETRLQLLRGLTAAAPSWAVWKGADSDGGDVDSIAVRDEWPAVQDAFVTWAAEQRLDSVLACTHAPGMLILAGLDGRSLFQLDVVSYKQLHGALLFRAGELVPLLELDAARRFRRLRSGAEGLLRLALDSRDGEARGLVENDREGAELAAARVGAFGAAALRAAAEGRRVPLLARAAIRALAAPRLLAGSLLFDVRWRWRCPVLRALRAERTAPEDVASWLTHARRTHRVQALR
jgi:hypothetical protein